VAGDRPRSRCAPKSRYSGIGNRMGFARPGHRGLRRAVPRPRHDRPPPVPRPRRSGRAGARPLRPAPHDPPRSLRRRPSAPDGDRQAPRGGPGLRPGRRAEPPFRGSPLAPPPPTPRPGRRHRRGQPPAPGHAEAPARSRGTGHHRPRRRPDHQTGPHPGGRRDQGPAPRPRARGPRGPGSGASCPRPRSNGRSRCRGTVREPGASGSSSPRWTPPLVSAPSSSAGSSR
jgi:hypothetical protein